MTPAALEATTPASSIVTNASEKIGAERVPIFEHRTADLLLRNARNIQLYAAGRQSRAVALQLPD